MFSYTTWNMVTWTTYCYLLRIQQYLVKTTYNTAFQFCSAKNLNSFIFMFTVFNLDIFITLLHFYYKVINPKSLGNTDLVPSKLKENLSASWTCFYLWLEWIQQYRVSAITVVEINLRTIICFVYFDQQTSASHTNCYENQFFGIFHIFFVQNEEKIRKSITKRWKIEILYFISWTIGVI